MTNLKFKTAEPYIFYAVVFLNMLPAVLFSFFPTMDGPAHLYNANIIRELVWKTHSGLSDYYRMNAIPVPNELGHFILASLRLFLPAFLAEKVLVVSYLFLLPYSFRYMVRQYGNPGLSTLILPFCYSYLFYLGFYNLSLSLILLFSTIGYWKRHENRLNIRTIAIVFCLLTLTWFAHVFVYSILLFTLYLMSVQSFARKWRRKGSVQASLAAHWKKFPALMVAAFPSVLLLLNFMLNIHIAGSQGKRSTAELIRWIKDVRPLIALGYEQELRFTEIYYHLLIGLSAILIFILVQSNRNKPLIALLMEKAVMPKNLFLFMGLVLLFLYFTVPDSISAGMMSDRLCLLFFIYMVAWLAVHTYPQWLVKASVAIVLFVNFGLVLRYAKATMELSAHAASIVEASGYIKPYSTVLPVNDSDHWLEPHFSNYLGIENPLVILENYEATAGWFPVKWKDAGLAQLTSGTPGSEEGGFIWKPERSEKERRIDYVFIWGRSHQLNAVTMAVLSRYYDTCFISKDEYARLYLLKSEFR